MSATAPVTVTVLCPRCYKPFASASDTAAHLIDEHGVHGIAAIREARAEPPRSAPVPTPTTTNEAPMPTGVYQRKPPDPTKTCSYCKGPNTAHKAWCKRRAKGLVAVAGSATPRRKGGRPRKAAAGAAEPTTGGDPVATMRAALLVIEAELASLRALKVEMAKALGL